MRVDALLFRDAEAAWFWFVEAHDRRHDGAKTNGPSLRPICIEDVLGILSHMLRRRVISNAHILVGMRYAREGRVPVADYPAEAHDAALWRELMERLRPYLSAKEALDEHEERP